MKQSSIKYICLLILILFGATACRKAQDFSESEQDPRLSGGSQTSFNNGSGAFDQSFFGLSAHDQLIHDIGDTKFSSAFVTAPAHVNPGIGPLFNNISCGSCHPSQGSGSPPQAGQNAGLESFFLLLSNGGVDVYGAPADVPGFGNQLQNNSSYGKPKEGDYNVTYTNQTFTYPDGTTAILRVPTYNIVNTYLPFSANIKVSPRMAPSVFGLGLLDNIGDATLLAMSNQASTDTNIFYGKPNYVWDVVKNKMSIGKFGHKCERPTLEQQVAEALQQDIGITNKLFPTENCVNQSQYYDDGLNPEITDSTLSALVYYMKTIAVPARRNVTDPQVLRGEQLFKQAKCAGCHRPTIVTDVSITLPQLSNQTIHPYSDLLLHDLGSGLADGRAVYSATGQEWRTCPLWGIGLTQIVTGQTSFLHDGRASTLEQAILWHGGQANYSKIFFTHLPKNDRDAVIAFLNSL
jgi:CxxC motif-containing protein (DUF1111 family)